MKGFVFRVLFFSRGLGFVIWGLGFGVWGLGFVSCFRVWGLGFGVWGLFGVWQPRERSARALNSRNKA